MNQIITMHPFPEDMHLKNFSVVTQDKIVTLSPFYDLINSTIVLGHASEEIALPLHGKKKNIRKRDFFDYFAKERLNLNEKVINNVIQDMRKILPRWEELINICFLSDAMKEKYRALLIKRCTMLN